jgi:hypothetical protein
VPSDKPTPKKSATSPSASGPAGALFEGQVGAHYLLTMLTEADPRGLPGVQISRVELQRAGEGYPLDDVIVCGVTSLGETAVLEVQVKRTTTFAPSDMVFKGVVAQLAQAYQKLDISHQRHQFAVATARTSSKITGPYQDVLRWAREVSSVEVFFGRINGKKIGNDDMRAFVETVRAHLAEAGCGRDDKTVWEVLRRFQILVFDYDAPGSQSQELAIERARSLLDPADTERGRAFWKVLTETAVRVAASGGDLDRNRLVEEVTGVDGFRLLGARRNRTARETLFETSRLAAYHLRGSIAGVILARSAPLEAAREARDSGRYVEIRGKPGVGKSGVLGMLVDQVLSEGRAIVLTPDRTISGGWLAFKSALQIEGGPEAFLSDLANDGGTTLFVDSLDFFVDPGKRATVIDLVRAAALVPALQVIVTARADFDKDEPNWLPPDVLIRLGRARPVFLDELGAEEIEELREAAPALRALLHDDHPARAISRNLFHLSRLLEVQGAANQLRSEIDLLERWWLTADGPPQHRRERKRLLADLTEAILGGRDHIETRIESSVVDELIASGTLHELGLDSLVFHHDVLRDWGVAARLHESPSKFEQLPLTRTVPAALARGVELGARFVLERSEDGKAWGEYLVRVSPAGAHVSWRRWGLLAILRSELAFALLDRAFGVLVENDGALLRELIRTTLAVESRPLVEVLAQYGAHELGVPAGIYAPVNSSWATLAQWMLVRQAELPVSALPDIVELFQSFSTSMFFADPITPKIAVVLGNWLEEIEDAQDHNPLQSNPSRFAHMVGYSDLQKLGSDIRQAFLLMAAAAPERAQRYVRRLIERRNADYTIREIMKFRGTLAQAAPVEIANLTFAGLIPKEERSSGRKTERKTFTHLDSDFLPCSPAQGPFLDLLNAAPTHGLSLIRRLVDHVVSARGNGQESGHDGITLVFPTGPRFFPWKRSYFWSRHTDGCYAVESGLLALEAWAHSRIDRGDAPEDVIADVLGPEDSPAAFLLVAVDLVISHWPKTMAVAVPFLGSPELLVLDRRRPTYDRMSNIGFGGKEPAGPIHLADLEKRHSRGLVLEHLLGAFALDESADRVGLRKLLTAASARLGPPLPDDAFGDARFMARYALNLIEPVNWPSGADGRRVYVSPLDEAQHIDAIQKKHAERTMDIEVDVAIQNVIEDSGRASPELAERAVAYAQRLPALSDNPEDMHCPRTIAIVSAAMILARDGSDALLDQHEDWSREVFAKAFASTDRVTISQLDDSISFNPVAIATLGQVHLWRRRGHPADRSALLELASRDQPDAAHGMGAGMSVIRAIDRRLVPALMRCMLVAQVQPTNQWDDSEEVKEIRLAEHRERVAAAIRAEVSWLDGLGTEPLWPALPPRLISVRQCSLGDGEDDDAQAELQPRPIDQLRSRSAALWLRQLTRDLESSDLDWIVTFVDAYGEWTAAANGAGLKPNVELDNPIGQWNAVFSSLLAMAFTRMTPDQSAAHVVRAASTPDETFFSVATELVPAIDMAYFNGHGLISDTAVKLRSILASRLRETHSWRRECGNSKQSVEIDIGPAIAALFFNRYNPFTGASCYLLPSATDRIDPFLPELGSLVAEGPVPFCALLVTNLIEVSPNPAQLQFVLSSVLGWLQRQPTNTQLWVDSRIGARVTKWLDEVLRANPTLYSSSHLLKSQIDDVLARLVRIGVAQAHRLETLLVSSAESTKKED